MAAQKPLFEIQYQGTCDHCGASGEWTIMGPDGVTLGITFRDEDAAEDCLWALSRGADAECTHLQLLLVRCEGVLGLATGTGYFPGMRDDLLADLRRELGKE